MRTTRSAGLWLLGAAAAIALVGGASAACQATESSADTNGSADTDGAPAGEDGVPENDGGDGNQPAAAADGDRRRAENGILIVGDGMGFAHRELIRLTTVGRDGELAMDQLPYQGWTYTDPADPEHVVTDSAAAATALATGTRTENETIGVDVDGNPLTTLLERAEQAGKATGLVTTSLVTDATPAAFAAHTDERDDHSEIARQYLEESRPEVILGGGEDWWYPAGTAGEWPNDPPHDVADASLGTAGDLVDRARQFGYQYVSDATELEAADGGMLLGLFANGAMFEPASYDPVVSLPVMAAKALEVLSQDPDGFFLVIEEEGIDAMSHEGNARQLVEAGRSLDETVGLARDFAAEHANTLLVVVGDHETGGLTIEDIHGDDSAEAAALGGRSGFTLAGTDLTFTVTWATEGHSAAPTPAGAEGPGAGGMVDVRDNTDIHDLVLDAMSLPEA